MGGGIAVAVASSDSSTSASASSAEPKQSTSLQPVQNRTLSTTQDVSGTIGYGAATTVTIGSGEQLVELVLFGCECEPHGRLDRREHVQ